MKRKQSIRKRRRVRRKRVKRGRGLESLLTVDNAKEFGKFAIANASGIKSLGDAVVGWIRKGKKKKNVQTLPQVVEKKKRYTQNELDNMMPAERQALYNQGLI